MSPARNLILKFHEPRDGQRVALGQGKGGGRPAHIDSMLPRHRAIAVRAEGPTGAAGCRVVRVSGTEASWTRLPQQGDTLIARGEAAYCMWLRMIVVAAAWWDYGRTLEVIVRVVERSPVGRETRERRVPRAGRAAVALATVAIAGASAMADLTPERRARLLAQRQAEHDAAARGTYAHLPLDQMNQYLDQLRKWPEEQRPAILREVGEAVLSEAQTQSPVLTGFLQGTHTVLDDSTSRENGTITIGVNAKYALAVHETHPTRKRWFLRELVRHLPRVMEAALRRLARQKGAR